MSETKETDAELERLENIVSTPDNKWGEYDVMQMYDFACKLEVKRDLAQATFQELTTDSNAITLAESLVKMERERDDWKGAGIKIAYELVTAGINSAGILDGVCALKKERDALRQVARHNSDWFDCLVKDMAEILKCEPKPHIILEIMKTKAAK